MNSSSPLSFGEIEKIYDVPHSTLQRHVAHRLAGGDDAALRAGRPKSIGDGVLGKVVDDVRVFSDFGIGLTKFDLRALVSHHMAPQRMEPSEKPFLITKPTFNRWMNDHKDVVRFAMPRQVADDEFVRLTLGAVTGHFDMLRNLFDDHPVLEQEPGRVGNLDETSLENRHQSSAKYPVAQVKDANGEWSKPLNVVFGDNFTPRSTLTATTYADGSKGPALVVSKSSNELAGWEKSKVWKSFEDTLEGRFEMVASDKGVQKLNIFWDWFRGSVVCDRRKTFPTGPLLFILDQATVHLLTLKEKMALENEDVYLHFLPPGTTIWTQPNDSVIFGIFKKKFRLAKNFLMEAKKRVDVIINEDLMGVSHLPDGAPRREPDRTRGLGGGGAVVNLILARAAWAKVSQAAVKAAYEYTGIIPFNRDKVRDWIGSAVLLNPGAEKPAGSRSSVRLGAFVTASAAAEIINHWRDKKIGADEAIDQLLHAILDNPRTGWSRVVKMILTYKAQFAAKVEEASRSTKKRRRGAFQSSPESRARDVKKAKKQMSELQVQVAKDSAILSALTERLVEINVTLPETVARLDGARKAVKSFKSTGSVPQQSRKRKKAAVPTKSGLKKERDDLVGVRVSLNQEKRELVKKRGHLERSLKKARRELANLEEELNEED
jgi:hypothetical protein